MKTVQWLLESVVIGIVPIRYLLMSPNDVLAQFNMPWHGMACRTVFEAIAALVDNDWMIVKLNDDVLVHQEVLKLSSDAKKNNIATYQLTQNGGNAWSEMANADWAKSCMTAYEEDGEEYHILFEGLTERVIEEWVSVHRYHYSIAEELEYLDWEEVSPWAATYWKEFSAGKRLTCRVVGLKEHVPWSFKEADDRLAALSWFDPVGP